jgi:hypothetical protein
VVACCARHRDREHCRLSTFRHRNSGAVSAGLISREEYLREHAPDNARSEFVNQYPSGRESEGRALIFFRHIYYLHVPYAYGYPDTNWPMNPAELQTDDAWRSLFRNQHIPWVVRAPDYPESLSLVLERLAFSSLLLPQK